MKCFLYMESSATLKIKSRNGGIFGFTHPLTPSARDGKEKVERIARGRVLAHKPSAKSRKTSEVQFI